MATKKLISSVIAACAVFGTDAAVAFNATARTDYDVIGYPVIIIIFLIALFYPNKTTKKKKLERDKREFAEKCQQAEQGNIGAQIDLGIMYQYGKGVAKDETKAVYWYRKAAEQGNEDAKDALKGL